MVTSTSSPGRIGPSSDRVDWDVSCTFSSRATENELDVSKKRCSGRLPCLLGFFLARVDHHRDRQVEIGCQRGVQRDLQPVGARLERNQLVLQDTSTLVRNQGEGRLLTPVDLDLGGVADFVRVPVGKDSQANLVLIVRDS